MQEINLKCPCCKGEVTIVVTDHEGNIKGPIGSYEAIEYEADPWSGLAYQFWHDTTMTNGDCPIAHDPSDWVGLGCYSYDTKEKAIEVWNNCSFNRKNGIWLSHREENSCPENGSYFLCDEGFYHCSECKEITDWPHNFCPNCGAKMKGEHVE